MAMFHLLKIRTSIDIFKNEKCKVTFGLEYIFTCRLSSNMGRLIEVYFRSWCHYELRDMFLIFLV